MIISGPPIEHPTDWLNDRNYETPEALDIQLLNEHLRALLDGRTIEKPIYSFKEGRRVATKPVKLEPGQILLLDCLHGFYPPITEGISFRAIPALHRDDERDLRGRRRDEAADAIHGRAAHPPHAARCEISQSRRAQHDFALALRPLRRIVQHHPVDGLADHVVNGGMPFDLPVFKPFCTGEKGLLPKPEEFAPYAGFLDARIRYDRVKTLLESVEGFTEKQLSTHDFIPGDAVIREFTGGSTIQIPHNE